MLPQILQPLVSIGVPKVEGADASTAESWGLGLDGAAGLPRHYSVSVGSIVI